MTSCFNSKYKATPQRLIVIEGVVKLERRKDVTGRERLLDKDEKHFPVSNSYSSKNKNRD